MLLTVGLNGSRVIKPVLCACLWFLFIFLYTSFLFKFNGIKKCQQNMFTRDLYLHSGKIDRHFNPQFTHKTGFWDCKMGNFMQYKLQFDLHRFSGCVVCNMFVKQALKEISESTSTHFEVVVLSMHILPEDIPGKVIVSLRPARQLKRGQTLLKANWRPTNF